ncbi:MAG: hypothetical protein WCX85_01840 [Bacilli bacterium]|jgi:hypothetical protein|nr:hypothetical protein [Bacilli bacterium]
MPEEKKPLFTQKSPEELLLANRREFLSREFANSTPEFVEYGKKFLPKKHHFMILGDELIYLEDDKIAANEVFISDNPKMQITITELLEDKYVFDPFETKKLQLECNKAKFK